MFITPHGHQARFEVRPDTNDWNTVNAIGPCDEYALPSGLVGTAIDVGAHIGAATICLLLDNPAVHVIAVEPLPDNVAVLRANLALNGVSDRCTVVTGAVGATRIFYGAGGDAFAREHRFIGNGDWQSDGLFCDVPAVTLAGLAEDQPVAFLKTDCEGGEWALLDDPAVRLVEVIVGEWHSRDGYGPERLHELLDSTHSVTVSGEGGLGAFRAVRR